MVSYKVWAQASRPKTLAASFAPVLMGAAIAYGDGHFNLFVLVATLLCAMLIQIGTNFANDYYDFLKGADAERVGPTRYTQSKIVTPSQMKRAFILAFLAAMAIGIFLVFRGGWPILLIGIISVALGVLYTAGPYSLAYTGVAEIFVIAFFGVVAVSGTYYLMALEWSVVAAVAGVAPGLISTAILVANNLRDIRQDKKVGKKTLAVRFGANFARAEYIIAIVGALLIPVLLYQSQQAPGLCLWASCTGIFAVPSMHKVLSSTNAVELNGVLAQTAKLLMLYGLIFSLGYIL